MGEQEAIIVMKKERDADGGFTYSALDQAESLLSKFEEKKPEKPGIRSRGEGLDSIFVFPDSSPFAARSSYTNIQNDISSLVRLSKEIERELSPDTFPQRAAYNLRRYVEGRFFGKKQHSIDKMLDMQLAHLKNLTAALGNIIEQNEKERTALRKYHKGIAQDFFGTIRERETKTEIVESLDGLYQRVEKEFNEAKANGLTMAHPDFEKYSLTIIELKRKIGDGDSHYDMKTQQAITKKQEETYIRVIEQLTTISLNTCKELNQIVASAVTHIENTKRLYHNNYKMQQIVGKAAEALGTLSTYISKLNDISGKGLEAMYNATTEAGGVNSIYNVGTSSLLGRVDDIERAFRQRNDVRNKHLNDVINGG